MTDSTLTPLFHPEHPGSPYTLDDALYDLQQTQDHLWNIERRCNDASVSTSAATKKLARVQRFLDEMSSWQSAQQILE